jgi:gliding motility-associated-like protein
MLVMRDTGACNNPDTARKVINMNGLKVLAQFTSPDSVCLKSGMTFTDASINATGILWNFGDGQTSTATSPVHTFSAVGTYTVTLLATNPNTCNKKDSLKKTIRIKKLPVADFVFSPVVPVSNTPVQFTNKSKDADTYDWNFGDGTGTTEISPSHLFKRTGTFRVCLIARTLEGCADTVCKDVSADVHTAIDVPTGFSPNGDGKNDVLYVKGGAIETMNIKIFNRWGEKVFESSSLSHGWDGTYKGKPQEMDAFAYVLNATFIDGTTALKKGNITLVR